MFTPRVRLVTCLDMPEPDPDEELLRDAVAAAGIETEVLGWDDPAVPWTDGTPAVLRSPWNYHRHVDGFVAWAESLGDSLRNAPSIVRWNAHKKYLVELADRGLPVAPTALVERARPQPIGDILETRGWNRIVVKPAVSAGSYLTRRFRRDETAAAQDHLETVLAERGDALVQEYLTAVEGYGERALVWIDGELTHSVRKNPRFTGDDESVTGPLPIADDERALATRALAPHAANLMYGRVDVARDAAGEPLIMELELMEPSLFLRQHPPALDRFVAAIARWARTAGTGD